MTTWWCETRFFIINRRTYCPDACKGERAMKDQLHKKIFSHIAKLNITRENTYRVLLDGNDKQSVNGEFLGGSESTPAREATIWLEEMMASGELPEITWQIPSGAQLPEFSFGWDQKVVLMEQLNLNLSRQVVDEISNYIDEKVDRKFTAINNSFDHYYRSVVNLKENLAQNLTKEELDNILDEFNKKVSPGLIAMDFRVIWTFDDIEKEYNNLVKGLQLEKNGYIFNRYIFKEQVFQYLGAGLSYQLVNELIPFLKGYANISRKIEIYIENSDTDNYGIFVANLIHACSARFEHGEATFSTDNLTEYEKTLVFSLQAAWDKLLQAFELAIVELKELYKFTLLSLFGGLILHASDDFRALGLKIKAVSFIPLAIELESDFKNINFAVNDFNVTLGKINQLKAVGDLPRAIQLSDDVCKIVKTDEHLKACNVSASGSAIYVAGLNRYGIIAAYIWDIREKNSAEFVSMYEHLYSLLDITLKDEDTAALEVPSQTKLFAYYLQLLVNDEKFKQERISVIFDYIMRMVNRYENENFYQGEMIDDQNESSFYTLLVLAAQFVGGNRDRVSHPFVNICKYSDLTKEIVTPVLNNYKNEFSVDPFYKYFQSSFAKKLINSVFK